LEKPRRCFLISSLCTNELTSLFGSCAGWIYTSNSKIVGTKMTSIAAQVTKRISYPTHVVQDW